MLETDQKIKMLMKDNLIIRPLEPKDFPALVLVLADWLSKEECDYYEIEIRNILVEEKFDCHYYVAVLEAKVIGVVAYRSLQPKLLEFSTTEKAAELNLFYVAKEYRGGQGVGTALLNYLINQIKTSAYQELIVRSAAKFKDRAWGFYDKMGFTRLIKDLSESQIWSKKI